MDMKITFTGDPERYEKVAAIKAFRRLTDFGLKESKQFIECVVDGGAQIVSFPPPPPTDSLSSPTRMDQAIADLKFVCFNVSYHSNTSDKRDNVLNELKKLIKMAVEHDQNDIAIALLSMRDKLV